MSASSIGNAVGTAIQNFGNYSAQAASRANGISAAAQSAQGQFNQGSADLSNLIGSERIAQQYGYNSAQAAIANDYNTAAWDKAAAWNEAMWERQAEWNEAMWEKSANFNAEQAQIARDWQEKMMKTSYQRAVSDMKKAGLNPILAATGGVSTGVGTGSAASIGGSSMGASSMSPASGNMTSGGLLNGNQASEGSYTGQMEYMGGVLGLLSAAIGGVSSALTAFGGLGKAGESIADAIGKIFEEKPKYDQNNNGLWDEFGKDFNKHPSWYFDHRYDM